MTIIQTADYSPDAFNDILPGIGFNWKHINVRGGQDIIFQELGPLFIKHNVAEKFGIGVLHRHFDLAENERLVEVNNVSTPWIVGDAESAGGTLVPTSWLFRGNSLIPYEFSFDGVGSVSNEPTEHPQFLEELATTLKQLKLHRYLCLTVHPGPEYKGSVEFTVGRANISVHPSQVKILHTADSAFFFGPGYGRSDPPTKCEEYGKCEPKPKPGRLTADELAEMEKLDDIVV